jgi:hypothetical protein
VRWSTSLWHELLVLDLSLLLLLLLLAGSASLELPKLHTTAKKALTTTPIAAAAAELELVNCPSLVV